MPTKSPFHRPCRVRIVPFVQALAASSAGRLELDHAAVPKSFTEHGTSGKEGIASRSRSTLVPRDVDDAILLSEKVVRLHEARSEVAVLLDGETSERRSARVRGDEDRFKQTMTQSGDGAPRRPAPTRQLSPPSRHVIPHHGWGLPRGRESLGVLRRPGLRAAEVLRK